MQVSHANDHVTHAVIGGKQSIEFGISTSAEFFNILSSTLYKDQILAVVREVLCNAWDAHIEASCTDRPVLVTLTNEEFSIKDFGKGIHQDDMGLIYGTYGNSTKKNDGNQTGGFGLGCKAPFAYTDHFEVVSCHDGIRTIYTLAKSSAQAVGKPGITQIASFPTTESGLTVTIRIKPADWKRFNTLIKRIAYNGDMNMTLNGEQLDTLNFDISKGNFLLTRNTLLDTVHRVMVRYGNVVYPVENTQNEQAYKEIVSHLDKVGRGYCLPPFSIVFQAPPHSIAVTPSREALSMQSHTVKALGTLFKGFLDSLKGEFQRECARYAEVVTAKAIAEKRIDVLLSEDNSLPGIDSREESHRISDFESMAKVFLQNNYPGRLEYRKEDVTRRLKGMAQANLLDRGKVSAFLRELKEVTQEPPGQYEMYYRLDKPTYWLPRRVIAPLVQRLSQANLPIHQLYTCGIHDCNWVPNNREGMPPLVPATRCRPHHLLNALPYLRNIVVLTTRKQDLTRRASRHEVFQKAGNYEGYLVYVVGKKKGELEAARQFFAKEGMQVADLTVVDDREAAVQVKISTPRKPKKKGIVQLSSILGHTQIDTTWMQKDDAVRITDPEFVIQVSFKSGENYHRLGKWTKESSLTLVRLFGDKGGITNTNAVLTQWLAKGAKDFDEYIRDKLCSYILDNPRIAKYQAQQSEAILRRARINSFLLHAIYSNEALSKEFDLVNPLSNEDRMYLDLWETKPWWADSHPNTSKVANWLTAIPIDPAVEVLLKKMESPLLRLLNVAELNSMVRDNASPDLPRIIGLLKTILN